MKKTATINEFKFDSLSEMIAFLREDWQHRTIRWKEQHQFATFLDTEKQLGKNIDTFFLVEYPYDENPEVSSLEEYLDEDDNPLDEDFARDYNLNDFCGEERIEE